MTIDVNSDRLRKILFWERLRGCISIFWFVVAILVVGSAAIAIARDRAANLVGNGVCETTKRLHGDTRDVCP